MKVLEGWQNFYVIVGSSAGALIGLQFVVLSLVANRTTTRVDPQAGGTFSTPTIVHFTTVLLLAAILTSPWEVAAAPAAVYGGVGLLGFLYTILTCLRIRRQTVYRPEFEDWAFHGLLPALAYGGLVASAAAAVWSFREALFGAGAAALLLLLIGIHNAWDTVTFHVFSKKPE